MHDGSECTAEGNPPIASLGGSGLFPARSSPHLPLQMEHFPLCISELLPRRIDFQPTLLGRASSAFVMTDSDACGGKQTSALRLQHRKQNFGTFQNVPSATAPPSWKDLRIPRVHRCTEPDRSTQLQRAREELNWRKPIAG